MPSDEDEGKDGEELEQDVEPGALREGFRCSSFEEDSESDTGAREISDDDHPLTMWARKRKSITD